MSNTAEIIFSKQEVKDIFDKIEEYQHLRISNMETLTKGMSWKANQLMTDGYTPTKLFVENLIKAAVEAGSLGVAPKKK